MTSTNTGISDILRRVILYTGIVAVGIAVIGGLAGYAAAGVDGLLSALTGTAVAVVFAAITAGSIMVASKYTANTFFAIVLGAWLLKIVIFMALLALVTGLAFVVPMVLFLSMVAAIVGTLAVDVVVVMTARQTYTDESRLPNAAPGDGAAPDAAGDDARGSGSIS